MNQICEPLLFGIASAPSDAIAPGRVSLVGAGPGDPLLLTVKAERALRQARLVLYDALVSAEVLDLLPPGAECIDVGKRCGRHAMPQQQIVALMLRLARAGHDLLRLKGGDPYIFGRGGEEAQALAAAGIPFEVIPGISAAQGAAAAAGMPLTHRDHADTLVWVTGHRREAAGPWGGEHPGQGSGAAALPDLDWARLARPRQTLVVYMGLGTLEPICRQLMAHGLAPETPAATIERATRPDQRCTVGSLATLPALALAQGVQPPALIVIGGVVALRASLATVGERTWQAGLA